MTNYEKVIEMLTNGIDRYLAEKIIKEFCPAMFGLKNNQSAIKDYACTRCDFCWLDEYKEN